MGRAVSAQAKLHLEGRHLGFLRTATARGWY
jgi:hypothetical protein